MTTLSPAHTAAEHADGRKRRAPTALLQGLGSAMPRLVWRQQEIADVLADVWGLRGEPLDRWRRICAGSAIETRHGVASPDDVIGLTTAERMTAFEQHAPGLGTAACRAALAEAGVEPRRVTDLIVVSCTGFSAPGLDVALVTRLGLAPGVRRLSIGFMGCFGAITGLRAATAQCAADPSAVALVVCVELCSLHLRDDRGGDNMVASALFGDGAAAAVIGASPSAAGKAATPHGRLSIGRTLLVPEGRDWMSWRITDRGFAMTLSREVPVALRRSIRSFAGAAATRRRRWFVVHPGGPGILDAAESGLDARSGEGLEVSRDVLRRRGNMSSGTVLVVLEEALRRSHQPPGLLLAFGPGLTLESLELLPV